MLDGVAWVRNTWSAAKHARLELDDLGVIQGVVVVDRLRTCSGLPLDVPLHVERLRDNCNQLGIELPAEWNLAEIIVGCAERNRELFAPRDFSIVTLVTPGVIGSLPAEPTLIVHSQKIEWRLLDRWYRLGQPLEAAPNRNVPTECWPTSIKTRARLQYYLADRAVADFSRRHALADNPAAVLLDIEGNLTETSAANVLIVEGRRVISPPLNSILRGVSMRRTLRLAAQAGLETCYETISLSRAQQADEILLCGSTGCLWPAARLGQATFKESAHRPVFQELKRLWVEDVQFDYVQQAADFSKTSK